MSERKQLTIWLEKELFDKLSLLSDENFTSLTGMIRILIKEKAIQNNEKIIY